MMRKLVGITALFAGLALLFSAGAMPAYADPGNSGNSNAKGGNANAGANTNAGGANGGTSRAGSPNGANGTVKIHDWPDHKNSSDMANDPKVCEFEVHGFKFDPAQSGRWWVQGHQWGNGDFSKSVLTRTYTADANGDWTSGPHKLSDGHYKLFVEMTHTAGNSGKTVTTYKHKVFKVECPTSSANNGAGSTTNSSSNNNASRNTSTSNTNTNNTTTTDVDSSTAGSVVAGFESAPTGAAIIGTGPEVPAGIGLDDSHGLTGVNGAESAPLGVAGSESTPEAALAGIASLPATSTGAPALGLAGLAITGLGLALLRRQPK